MKNWFITSGQVNDFLGKLGQSRSSCLLDFIFHSNSLNSNRTQLENFVFIPPDLFCFLLPGMFFGENVYVKKNK